MEISAYKKGEIRTKLTQLSRTRWKNFQSQFGSEYQRTRNTASSGTKHSSRHNQSKGFSFGWGREFALARWRSMYGFTQMLSGISFSLKLFVKGNTVRVFVGFLILSVLAYAIFFAIMLNRYDNKHWADRLSERTLSPIYGRDDVLVGAIQSAGSKANSTSTYDLGFIPLPVKTPIPPVYRAALLEREDRGLRDGGALQIFGIDLPRMLWAWINRRGGSSLTMQIVKNLEGWGSEKSLIKKILRKLEELPASIQLYRYIASQGEDTQSAVVRLYAGIHKIWTPDTGIRGIEAGARVTFDETPDKLSSAQQLLLSAVTGIPLAPPGEHNANTISCQKIWPKKQNEAYDSSVEDRILGSSSDFEIRQFRIRKSQCRTIWRAKHTAQKLFDSGYVFNSQEALRQTLDELDSYEVEGIRPVNPFTGLSDRESVSISKRTREVVTPHLLNLLYLESKTFRRDTVGEPLRTNLLSGEQSEFVEKWPRLSEQQTPIYKWKPGGFTKVQSCPRRRRLRRTDAVGNSGRTTGLVFYAAFASVGISKP